MNDPIGWSAAGELEEEVRVELLHLGETGDASLAFDDQEFIDAVLARSVPDASSNFGKVHRRLGEEIRRIPGRH